jgi:hypothetical protein
MDTFVSYINRLVVYNRGGRVFTARYGLCPYMLNREVSSLKC